MKYTDRSLYYWLRQYVMASYLYYELDLSVMSDTEFDNMCKYLVENWNWRSQAEKEYCEYVGISEDGLQAGTGYHLVYSEYCKLAAKDWYKTKQE